ncbi:MAG: aminotransferase class III-fold pyridoxal phosphate-dependent enzyme, partial [Calditrichaeota bacterium]|nr:aminotransferase class III-fold pyridoxal phosphate-dependent enzyme [Calditrichota bacterium]
DEVQSGYGRSGRFFAHQLAGIEADLITIAKGMGNGFPVAGMLSHPKFEGWPGMLGTTFGGNHLACAAGLAVLEVLRDDNLIDHAAKTGAELMTEIGEIGGPIKELRGAGLMIGIELDGPAAALRKDLLFREHIFTGSSSDPNTLRLLPPLSIGAMEIEQFIGALKRCVE